MNCGFNELSHEFMVDVVCKLKELTFFAEKTLYENKL